MLLFFGFKLVEDDDSLCLKAALLLSSLKHDICY